MSVSLRNTEYLNTKDPKLGEFAKDVEARLTNIAIALGLDPSGSPATPPNVGKLEVSAKEGIFHATITDNGDLYRNINYYLEYSQNKNFDNSTVVDLGSTRGHRAHYGNQNLYWRAYSQYKVGGPPSTPVYHSTGDGNPSLVMGGNPTVTGNATVSITGPNIPISTGSGTNQTSLGGYGAGKTSFISRTGRVPKLG